MPDSNGPVPLGAETLASARSFLGGLNSGTLITAPPHLLDQFARAQTAYEQFPELEGEYPRRDIIGSLLADIDSMPDDTAIPILMFCAALGLPEAQPIDGLLGRLIRAGRKDAVIGIVNALTKYRPLGAHELSSAIEQLQPAEQDDALLATMSAVVGHLRVTPDPSVRRSGAQLRNLLFDNDASTDPVAALLRVQSARRHRDKATIRHPTKHDREPLLALAERVTARLSRASLSPPPPEPPARVAWPSRRMSFSEFFMQLMNYSPVPVDWLPRMWPGVAGERAEKGVQTAGKQVGHVVWGPYYRLTPGRYRATFRVVAGRPWKWTFGSPRVAVIEAVSGRGAGFIATRNLRLADIRQQKGGIPLEFTAAGEELSEEIELRLWTAGLVPMRLSAVTVERIGQDAPATKRR